MSKIVLKNVLQSSQNFVSDRERRQTTLDFSNEKSVEVSCLATELDLT